MYRHMIQDVLILDQGFLDFALHPIVLQVLKEYLGARFQLVESERMAVSSHEEKTFTVGMAMPGTIRKLSLQSLGK